MIFIAVSISKRQRLRSVEWEWYFEILFHIHLLYRKSWLHLGMFSQMLIIIDISHYMFLPTSHSSTGLGFVLLSLLNLPNSV